MHIPFIFFTGKESTLIIIDEIDRNSISNALSKNIVDATFNRSSGGSFKSGGLEFDINETQ
jgi:hypothetical protein